MNQDETGSLQGIPPMLEIAPILQLACLCTAPLASAPAVQPGSAMERLFGPEKPALALAPDAPEIPHHPALSDTWFVGVGATLMTSNTEARLQSSTGVGAIVDFEDTLGLSQTQWVPQGIGRWRFSERWRLEAEYFRLNRNGSKTIEQDITWGDQSIAAGTLVETEFDVSVARVSCGYSFFKTEDKEIGLALGFHVTDFKATVGASGGTAETAKLLAPLPVLSLYDQFALTDQWAIASRLDIFKLAYDPYRGHVLSVGIDALYQPWRHVGIGLGWRTLQIRASVDDSDWRGDLNTNYQGPVLFLSTSF